MTLRWGWLWWAMFAAGILLCEAGRHVDPDWREGSRLGALGIVVGLFGLGAIIGRALA